MTSNETLRLNLGCGCDYRAGYINVDNSRIFKADRYFNLEDVWPIDANSISQIIAFQIVEHIHDLQLFMREAHRVLINLGMLHIKAPWWSGHWAVGDPTHVRLINDMTFNPWCCWFTRYTHINDGCRFDQVEEKFNNDPGWGKDSFLKRGGFSEIEEYELFLRKI